MKAKKGRGSKKKNAGASSEKKSLSVHEPTALLAAAKGIIDDHWGKQGAGESDSARAQRNQSRKNLKNNRRDK